VTTIRIAHAEPRPGRLANGGFHISGHLVVLADDAGHRAVPIWMQGADDLANLLERPAGQAITDSVPQELTIRLLGAARVRVTGVDIDVTEAGVAELRPEVTVTRIGLAGPTGTRQVTADLGLGLALAAAAAAPAGPPFSSRPSTPTTTAAPTSPSAARSAATSAPGRAGFAWRSCGTGGEGQALVRTTASPSPAAATGPGTRSRRGSPLTPTSSGSASH
jgi:hypothetical protein